MQSQLQNAARKGYPQEVEMLNWEKLKSQVYNYSFYRAKVPGGWLISMVYGEGAGLTFYPDPEHKWDGNSLP
jgi:hypothetical protein